jgi:guanylate kinase
MRPIVVTGPSGAGKSTLLKRLFAEFPSKFTFSISHTTRTPREGETNGKEYHFVDRTTFNNLIAEGTFLEYAEFSGNLYGTSMEAIKDSMKDGKVCILDVDLKGLYNVKRANLNAASCLIKLPSLEMLEKRLRGRNTESEESLQSRLAKAQEDLKFIDENACLFDAVIVNEDFEEAYQKFKNFVLSVN